MCPQGSDIAELVNATIAKAVLWQPTLTQPHYHSGNVNPLAIPAAAAVPLAPSIPSAVLTPPAPSAVLTPPAPSAVLTPPAPPAAVPSPSSAAPQTVRASQTSPRSPILRAAYYNFLVIAQHLSLLSAYNQQTDLPSDRARRHPQFDRLRVSLQRMLEPCDACNAATRAQAGGGVQLPALTTGVTDRPQPTETGQRTAISREKRSRETTDGEEDLPTKRVLL